MARSRTRRTMLAAATVALSVVVAACGTADSGNQAVPTEPGPGVTDETVKIGVITLKPSTAGGGSGFNIPDYGDLPKQVDLIVESLNASEGIAGRQVEAVVREFDSSTDSVQTETDLCTAFTQDDEVFAVVLLGQREASAFSCYESANTLMIDAGGVGKSQSVFEGLSPYFWAPSFPTLESYAKATMETLTEEDFFEGDVKVGLFIENTAGYQSTADTIIKPALADLGITEITEAEFDVSSNSSLGNSAGVAVNTMKAAEVDRLLFLGRGDMVGFFTSIAAPQQYTPRLALGSFEDPEFAALNPTFYPPSALEGSVGVGFDPATDGVGEGFPAAGPEKECIDLLSEGGEEIESRADAKRALRYCDALNFLKAVGDKIGPGGVLNAEAFRQAAQGLGEEWQGAASIGTLLADGVYAPASEGRTLKWNGESFEYTSDARPLPR